MEISALIVWIAEQGRRRDDLGRRGMAEVDRPPWWRAVALLAIRPDFVRPECGIRHDDRIGAGPHLLPANTLFELVHRR